MTKEVSYQKLYEIDLEMEQISQRVLGILLRSRIDNFYKENGLRIKTMYEKIEKIQKEFCEFENGKLKMTKPEKEEGKPDPQPTVIFLEGKTKEMLNAAYAELMAQTVPINI